LDCFSSSQKCKLCFQIIHDSVTLQIFDKNIPQLELLKEVLLDYCQLMHAYTQYASLVSPSRQHTTFTFYTTPMSWQDARQVCRATPGGDLATIVDASELSAIITSDAFNYTDHGYEAWIGLNDLAKEGSFVSANGVLPQYRPWLAGEPNNSGGSENCAHIVSKQLALADKSCDNRLYFLCERSSVSPFFPVSCLPSKTVSKKRNLTYACVN
jgi:hypothetical protein